MTTKQKLFIEKYLGEAHFNAAAAARLAGYSDAKNEGYRLKQREDVKAAIAERMKEAAMDADECLARLAEHARGSLEPFLAEGSEGELWPDLTTDAARANLHLLKKIKPKKREGGPSEDRWTETEIELELHDPQAALVQIGRHHRLFTDKSELTGKDGGPIETHCHDSVSPEEIERIKSLSAAELAREYFAALGDPRGK